MKCKKYIYIVFHITSNTWFSLVITIYISFGSLMLSYLPCILDMIIPMNKSRSRQLLIDVEYFVDKETYFFIIIIHMFVTQYAGCSTIMAVATLLIAYVLHTCAMFKIAR